MKRIIYVFLAFTLVTNQLSADTSYYGTPPVGWYWGNQPQKIKNKKQSLPKTPLAQLEVIKRALDEAKARAVLYPTPENVYNYLVFQHWVQEQSVLFTDVAQNVVAVHPDLNYAIKNPMTSTIRQVQLSTENKEKTAYVKALARTSGLFYFYRGKNEMDALQANIIAQFAKSYGFKLIGIPMDGYGLSALDNRPDTGQSKTLAVAALPALFLINPKQQNAILISYGYFSIDELLDDLYQRTQTGDHSR